MNPKLIAHFKLVRNFTIHILSLGAVLTSATSAWAQPQSFKDIEYAVEDGISLRLDIHLPENVASPHLIVWVHGGAWREGSKDSAPMPFVSAGYAMASVDYRLSGQARFPAQVHDIKAAIRFLRAHATQYGYDANRIVIAGDSAGGHLAALVGVTNGHETLEGSVGVEYAEHSSDVQGIIDYYGPTNFKSILAQSTPHGLSVRVPALQMLLGSQPDENEELAVLASPVAHVDATDPPLLIFHGDQDPQVPINQSHELQGAYESNDLSAEFIVVHGAAHGGRQFYSSENMAIATAFLDGIFKNE